MQAAIPAVVALKICFRTKSWFLDFKMDTKFSPLTEPLFTAAAFMTPILERSVEILVLDSSGLCLEVTNFTVFT